MQTYANLSATNKQLYKAIHNLQEHLQKTFTKIKCNVKL
jgi:hypothetical protein